MSKKAINDYYNQVHQIRRAGIKNEGALSMPFFLLVMHYAQSKKYQFHSQITIKSKKTGKNIRPDGILMNDLRVHRGYWESKDPDDKLEEEIEKKLHKDGYPSNNTLFEDSQTAILIQEGEEVMRIDMEQEDKLNAILTAFIQYQPAEVRAFEKALEAFKEDIPQIVKAFRELFDKQSKTNKEYQQARDRFWELCKEEINPDIAKTDVREMLIQHILTEDLFTTIFDDASFLKFNIIAKELEGVINTVLTREVRKNQLSEIRHYYQTLNATAATIVDHNEKQKFLKTVYENFYKVYNPKGADRLGVVYTPNEIVRFMVESVDYLLEKHFHKNLHDKGVDILDPATGTGTFITDIIDYIPPQYLADKYQTELHANEVSILPYYIANLNIEYTYHHKMGKYVEFENICFVDTLDNVEALTYSGKQQPLFGFNSENTKRIKKQNERKISVIIGNPPYNANQQNFNDFNKNRDYPEIDKRIKDTFVKHSTAQKTKVYDMYARFYRWAMDRVDKDGIIAFVTNNSFINSRTYDGFRKCVVEEFNEIWIIDLKGNARTAGKQRKKEAGNVFDDAIRVGISICFLVKNTEKTGCTIYYNSINDYVKALEKRSYLKDNHLKMLNFEKIRPSKKNNWINLVDNDFEELLPLADKKVKAGKSKEAIFKLFSLGIATNRDEWVYDFSEKNLQRKAKFFCKHFTIGKKKYKKLKNKTLFTDTTIKYTSELLRHFERNSTLIFNNQHIIPSIYRPFVKKWNYYDKIITHRIYQQNLIFPIKKKYGNITISFSGLSSTKKFQCLATKQLIGLDFLEKTQCLPFYVYDEEGNKHENITDWGKTQFTHHYKDKTITKTAIFHYTYAVLHYPKYRQKYELNLKREFPRLPFYKDFWQWSTWGKQLMDLHLNYETIEKHPLQRIEQPPTKGKVKVKLKAAKDKGEITLDDQTTLIGIPAIAWTYKLGNRSALEWILDQYKEKKPRDKTIAEKFNTYRFADYKEQVIELLQRVCTVSVRTMDIVKEMIEK